MEYERIHKVQVGIISPSKLRMKLMGQRKKDGGSKSNSSRTSPSKLEDSEFLKNNLLPSNSGVSGEEVSSGGISSVTQVDRSKTQQFQKMDSGNSSSVHPIRSIEDENLDYDSNASSSSFEFHKGERSTHVAISRSLLKPMSSKWNDAEKWIINRQNMQNHTPKNTIQNRTNRAAIMNGIRGSSEPVSLVKRVDFCEPVLQSVTEKFSFEPEHEPVSVQSVQPSELIDPCHESEDLKEVRSVSMRDMGTEMTPIPSQEPSMTSTPIGATTPLRSPNSSIPSTPRRAPASTPIDHTTDDDSRNPIELSEHELKVRTRKEIVQLGVQLGKMNIAAWASKEDKEKNENVPPVLAATLAERSLRIEYEKRAAAWEDAEKSKHNSRFIREEIKIQAWESQQKAKLEAEVRRIEAEVEQRRARAQEKMVKRVSMVRQRAEVKLAAADARKNRQAAQAAAQAEYIRQTGRIPPSPYGCCGWW